MHQQTALKLLCILAVTQSIPTSHCSPGAVHTCTRCVRGSGHTWWRTAWNCHTFCKRSEKVPQHEGYGILHQFSFHIPVLFIPYHSSIVHTADYFVIFVLTRKVSRRSQGYGNQKDMKCPILLSLLPCHCVCKTCDNFMLFSARCCPYPSHGMCTTPGLQGLPWMDFLSLSQGGSSQGC